MLQFPSNRKIKECILAHPPLTCTLCCKTKSEIDSNGYCSVYLQQTKEKCTGDIEKPTGVLLYSLASSSVKEDWQVKFVAEYIANKKLATSIQLTGIL